MFLPHRTYRDNEQNALTLGLLQEEGMTNRMFENYIFDRDTLYDVASLRAELFVA